MASSAAYCLCRAPVPRKRKAIVQKEAKPARAVADGSEVLIDPWGSEAGSLKPENFEDEAQAIAAKLRTAFGYVRPAKRRCCTTANSCFASHGSLLQSQAI